MSDTPEAPSAAPAREACFHCSEPAALSARICPRCQQSLLVDVVNHKPIHDPKVAYAAARSVARLGLSSGSVVELKQTLSRPRALLVSGVTRERGQQALAACSKIGLAAALEPHRETAARRHAPLTFPRVPMTTLVAVALVAAGLWLFVTRESGAPSEDTDADEAAASVARMTTAEIAKVGGASTVSLSCWTQIGTGFFVAADKLVTNAHVLCDGNPNVDIHFENGRQITGRVLSRNQKFDLALVDVPHANARPLPLGDASLLEPGDKVVIIGTPHGMDHTVHEGSVSHVGRTLFGVVYVQVDANVNPGNSGGPLFNEAGELVGIVTLKAEGAEGIGFALPINYVYDGPTALVNAGRPPSPSWQQMLARAQQEELVERDRAATAFSRTALLAATMQSNDLYLIVLRRSQVYPGVHGVDVSFEQNGRELCSETIYISEWRTLEEVIEERDASEITADIRWLREHDLADDLWYGAGVMRVWRQTGSTQNDCADRNLIGAEAVGLDAEEGYNRVTVSVTNRR